MQDKQNILVGAVAGATLYALGSAIYSTWIQSSNKTTVRMTKNKPKTVYNGLDEEEKKAMFVNILADKKLELLSSLDGFVEEFCEHASRFLHTTAINRLRRMLKYTTKGGKMTRGVMTLTTIDALNGQDNISLAKQHALAWCIEIMQAAFLVADDIMDGSVTRRGNPCWYKVKDIKMDAVNDTMILESFIFFLLRRYFRDTILYTTLVDLYHETALVTQFGQSLDLLGQPQGSKGSKVLDNFTPSLYFNIITWKTAIYSFYCPIAAGMIVSGYDSPEQLELCMHVCKDMGVKFQIQDDYLDCFQDPSILGKIGTDLRDHKCTWLLMRALEICSPIQRRDIIEQHLGKEDEKDEEAMRQLYRDLGLVEMYAQQETQSYRDITNKITANNSIVPKTVFEPILLKIHNRQK